MTEITYPSGRVSMTMELKETCLDIGKRRVGRLMRINAIKLVRTNKYRVATKTLHLIAPKKRDDMRPISNERLKPISSIIYIMLIIIQGGP